MAANTDAYRALIERLRDLDGSVFTPAEAQRVRDAADARLFGDEDQIAAAREALEMLDALVEAARLSSRTSQALADLLCSIETVSLQSS
jgi:hypothetical protein